MAKVLRRIADTGNRAALAVLQQVEARVAGLDQLAREGRRLDARAAGAGLGAGGAGKAGAAGAEQEATEQESKDEKERKTWMAPSWSTPRPGRDGADAGAER